mmetsp:Transcript_1243/g.2680  ORF Transcript_1243/g.2680 Transcript_1243/m.2680 type:complete len:202 (-) Transcript_1243:306-911(-)
MPTKLDTLSYNSCASVCVCGGSHAVLEVRELSCREIAESPSALTVLRDINGFAVEMSFSHSSGVRKSSTSTTRGETLLTLAFATLLTDGRGTSKVLPTSHVGNTNSSSPNSTQTLPGRCTLFTVTPLALLTSLGFSPLRASAASASIRANASPGDEAQSCCREAKGLQEPTRYMSTVGEHEGTATDDSVDGADVCELSCVL